MKYREHEFIYLQPWCEGCQKFSASGEGRQWCRDDVWVQCDEVGCKQKTVQYKRVKP